MTSAGFTHMLFAFLAISNVKTRLGARINIKRQIARVPGLDHALAKVGEGQEFLQHAQAAVEIGKRWQALAESLQKAKDAATDSGAVARELGDTLSGVKGKITEYELESLFDGKMDLNDFKHLANVGVCLDVMKELLSCAEVLDTFSNLAKTILEVADSVRSLAEATAELVSAFADLDLGNALPPLLEKATEAIGRFHAESEKLASVNRDMKPLIKGWDGKSLMEKGWHLAQHGDDIMDGFNRLSSSWAHIQELHNEAMDIQTDMEGLVVSMSEVSSPLGAESGSSATEEISADKCETRRPRRFSDDANVDDATMACWTPPMIGGKWCNCRSEGDCYVTSENRPEPSEKKRCLKPV